MVLDICSLNSLNALSRHFSITVSSRSSLILWAIYESAVQKVAIAICTYVGCYVGDPVLELTVYMPLRVAFCASDFNYANGWW